MITPAEYTRVARAIAWLGEHAEQKPSLPEAARAAGLSGAHFQRIFTQWAGISPKRFLQARTAERALELLRDGRAVLDAAYEAGLSGSSRLHDLVVHAEAVTPGQVKARGRGVRITYGWSRSPFGAALIATTDVGLCHLAFEPEDGSETAVAELRSRWPAATMSRDDEAAGALAAKIFPGSLLTGGPLALHVRGTNFQLKVWDALLRVPLGGATSYGALARDIGMPVASRAVGSAVGGNPISWLIPCHRVLRGDGGLGGYAWGPARKRAMLVWERLQADERPSAVRA
jgi:AraC family transcriptional regulator of adaptative response/methylated-DNA-[protein]-cysteine methyltransferase